MESPVVLYVVPQGRVVQHPRMKGKERASWGEWEEGTEFFPILTRRKGFVCCDPSREVQEKREKKSSLLYLTVVLFMKNITATIVYSIIICVCVMSDGRSSMIMPSHAGTSR